jgi:hypothetical protein
MEALRYFENFFKDPSNYSIVSDQVRVIREYPRFFSVEEGANVVGPVSLEEIKKVLDGFEKQRV